MPFARPFATKGSVVAAAAKRLITIYRCSFRPGGIHCKDGPLLVKQRDLFRQGIDQRLEQFDEASAGRGRSTGTRMDRLGTVNPLVQLALLRINAAIAN